MIPVIIDAEFLKQNLIRFFMPWDLALNPRRRMEYSKLAQLKLARERCER
jgi:hypothetical protein